MAKMHRFLAVVLLVGFLSTGFMRFAAVRSESTPISTQAKMFDAKWWIEKFVLPLVLAVLVKNIESNYNSIVSGVRDGLGWAGYWVKDWMIDDAAKETCRQVGEGNAESLVRAHMGLDGEDEIQEAVHNLEINCAGINEVLWQTA